ncbi:MAG: hypothetical protein A2107_09130 [Verrucomicrobia bacterium GWF2_62_7]|nr:MAG: hypothetical protein A2107_09130 [Verrucomicrobia bacterium GWF2_62_7]
MQVVPVEIGQHHTAAVTQGPGTNLPLFWNLPVKITRTRTRAEHDSAKFMFAPINKFIAGAAYRCSKRGPMITY